MIPPARGRGVDAPGRGRRAARPGTMATGYTVVK